MIRPTKYLLVPSLLLLCLPIINTMPAQGAEADIKGSTYLHTYQVDQILGADTSHAPLYQYLSIDVTDIENSSLSFHLYGWGRLDLAEESDPDAADGHVSSAHARYVHRKGQGQVRAGRIFVIEGTAMEAVDGFYFKESFTGFGVTLFGGTPNGDEDAQFDRGDTLAGTRAWIAVPGYVEAGLNFLYEDGDYEGDKRQEAGLDLWLQPTDAIFLMGKALYNLSASDFASGDLNLFFQPTGNLDMSLTASTYSYQNLFQAATNPAFSDSALDPDDEVTAFTGYAQWRPLNLLTLLGSVKKVDHKLEDPGDILRTEAGIDLALDGKLKVAGLRIAGQSGDLPENGYSDLRGFATLALGRLSLALDNLVTTYEVPIDGEDQALQFTGSMGWKISELFKVSGSLRLTRSPVYEEDVAGVIRLDYGHGVGSGVYR